MTTHHLHTRGIRGERGSALLEVAFTLPLLLLVSVGIFEFGRAFQTWQVLTNAVREGARVAVLPNATVPSVQDRVVQYMESGALSKTALAAATIDVDQTATIDIGTGTASASVVTVTYPFNFMVLNGVARLVVGGSKVGAPISMKAQAVMRNESQL
jgi:Flp pilus assembly protein TadG